ncbi:sirohydrochlorin ferrochelatase [Shouchella clausii]|uniref:sirohydrochlorin chelatase n=1 Tax=Shouchella tritolerans TaxID=2979466 RepID=UPI00078868B7|nr:sirohydrochlorin chelatase [Shouchella tritolerans]GIN13661.1 sirohydrochlorin ferrochelatase [Shouchella clausii]
MQAILYVGHGSRVKEGNDQFRAFLKKAKSHFSGDYFQTEAFIELSKPTIAEGIDRCVQNGATAIAIIPVLLLTAHHANMDIPQEIQAAKRKYPDVAFAYGKPFGIQADVIDVALRRLANAGLPLLAEEGKRQDGTTVLVVGRGSSDGNQPSDVAKIARLLYEKTACDNVETCFMAATTPTVAQGLAKVEKLGAQRVYVLPYLLFTGILMNELANTLADRKGNTATAYVLCEFLGSDDGLAPVLIGRVNEALREINGGCG